MVKRFDLWILWLWILKFSNLISQKYKRKIGRKLPPPKNATNTEIKSKAIILPEQSIASERAGLAVSKKGLTLKELLQQTSHHNAKVRKGQAFSSNFFNLHLIGYLKCRWIYIWNMCKFCWYREENKDTAVIETRGN